MEKKIPLASIWVQPTVTDSAWKASDGFKNQHQDPRRIARQEDEEGD
jgi:hypothetical protein